MAGKKSSDPPWQIIVEEIRSQNRATIGAVEASRMALEERIDRLDHESRARDTTLEMAIRELRLQIQENRAEIQNNGADIRQLQGDVRDLSTRV